MLPSNVDEVIISSSSSVCLQNHESYIQREGETLDLWQQRIKSEFVYTKHRITNLSRSSRKFSIILKTGQHSLFYFLKTNLSSWWPRLELCSTASRRPTVKYTHTNSYFCKDEKEELVFCCCSVSQRKGKTEKSSTKRRMAPHVGKYRLLRATQTEENDFLFNLFILKSFFTTSFSFLSRNKKK